MKKLPCCNQPCFEGIEGTVHCPKCDRYVTPIEF